MIFRNSPYKLQQEEKKYFILFHDSNGVSQKLEVAEAFYLEFRQMERRNRNLQQSDWRHKEHSKLTEQTLHKRARFHPKSIEDIALEAERSEVLQSIIDSLPEIQRRRFLLYYEYDYNYAEIGQMENCTAQAARRSVVVARETIKAEMAEYLSAL